LWTNTRGFNGKSYFSRKPGRGIITCRKWGTCTSSWVRPTANSLQYRVQSLNSHHILAYALYFVSQCQCQRQ
jgi:hypothetical protein